MYGTVVQRFVIKHIKFLKILQAVVYGLQSSKTGGGKGDGIVWVVQQEPDKLVILFQK